MAKGQDSFHNSGLDTSTETLLGFEAALASVEERYYSLSTATNDYVSTIGAACSEMEAFEKSFMGFLGKGAEIYERLEEIKKQEEELKIHNDLTAKHIELTEKAAYAYASYSKIREEASKSMQSIETKAYQALGNELLKLVEIHKFSIGEFAKAMAEQVKIELTGLSAKAAIWAIYETAMGLKDLAMGSPGTAGMHFAAAEEFGLIAGASLAAAAGVQALVPGDSEESSSSSSSSSGSSSSSSSSVQAYDSSSTGATQQVTVNIYNPLSEQNWQKIVEESIVPALNSAAEKNITISVNK
ncbi:MAG: hypothetical protein HY954_11590 [Deltaproteobacteria bacterium]|nr:hypothetical protein [Deltaproteobacteria bacterium]